MANMLEKYEKYLEIIEDRLLKKFFEQQKEYIHCKPGCSLCCETGQYPFSEVEFQYAMIGYETLSEDEKSIINSKAREIKIQKEQSKDDVFMHECPFLIDKKCSIYKYRGLICRTHGLMFYYKDKNGIEKNKGPDCVNEGLNYSEVYDQETGTISVEMWEKSGIKTEPLAYNLGQKILLNSDLAKGMELDFGESKALIDWF